MRKIWPSYLTIGLGSKVFLFFFALILAINVILYLFSSGMYARNQEIRAQQYNKDLIDQYVRTTDNYFLSLDNIAHALMFNTTIQISLSQTRLPSDLFRDRTYALDAIRLFEFGQKEITISIFSKDNPLRYYTVNSNISPFYDSRTDDWYHQLTNSTKNKIMIYDNHQRYLAERERKSVNTIAYKIWNVYSLETIGYLLIDIDTDFLKNLYDPPSTDINGLFIFSEDGKLVYKTNEIDQPEALFQRTQTEEGSTFLFDYNGQPEWAIFGESTSTGWVIVNVTSRKQLLLEIQQANTNFILTFSSLFVLALGVGFAYSKHLVRPLKQLTEELNRMKEGQFSVNPTQIETRSNDEVGQLIKSFNSMSKRINFLVAKAQNEELVRMESDFEALQQQINPHFLYNTLEMIMGMACLHEQEKIILVCKSLADMFRYNLNGQRSVTVQEELTQVKNYLTILGLRFPSGFEVRYDIDDDVLNERTIKLILQPFVENAISHGFARSNAKGLLHIVIQRQGDRLYFAVKDNGRGMEAQVLHELIDNMKLQNMHVSQQPYLTGKYRGIVNVYLRLSLTYADFMTFDISSQPNEGTTIEILVPPLTA